MTFYIAEPNHWIRCEIIAKTFGGRVTVRLYNDDEPKTGTARKGIEGFVLVDAR